MVAARIHLTSKPLDQRWNVPPRTHNGVAVAGASEREQGKVRIDTASVPVDFAPGAQLSSAGNFLITRRGIGVWNVYHVGSGTIMTHRAGHSSQHSAREFANALEAARDEQGNPFDWAAPYVADRLAMDVGRDGIDAAVSRGRDAIEAQQRQSATTTPAAAPATDNVAEAQTDLVGAPRSGTDDDVITEGGRYYLVDDLQVWEAVRGGAASDEWFPVRSVGTAANAAEITRLVQADAMFTPVELAKIRCTLEDQAYAYGGYNRPQEIFNRDSAPRYLTEGPLKPFSAGERFKPTWLVVESYLRAHPELFDYTPDQVEAIQQARIAAVDRLLDQTREHYRAGRFDHARALLDRAEIRAPFYDAYPSWRSRINNLEQLITDLGLTERDARFEGFLGDGKAQISVDGHTLVLHRQGERWAAFPQDSDEEIAHATSPGEVLPRIRDYLASQPTAPAAAEQQLAFDANAAVPQDDRASLPQEAASSRPQAPVTQDPPEIASSEQSPASAPQDPEPLAPDATPAPLDIEASSDTPVAEQPDSSASVPAVSPAPQRRPAPTVAVPQSASARITANLDAIRAMQQIESEERPATDAEREVLARWTSWGAASQIFDEAREEVAASAAQLRELIGESAWKEASRTVLNAFYTDPRIVRAMWSHLGALGFDGGSVLEPGCGAGAFIGHAPDTATMTGIELDSTTARITRLLYPETDIRTESFADTRLPEGTFDAAIGNVPFSGVRLHDPVHNVGEHSMHNHFILKSLALVKPGGVVVVVTSSFTMDATNPAARREIAQHADFLGAVRLPNRAHRPVGGTDVLTDIIVLRRRDGEPRQVGGNFELAVDTQVPHASEIEDVTIKVNEYFVDNPDMVLGELQAGTSMYGGLAAEVRNREDYEESLNAALAKIADRARAEGVTHSPRELAEAERRAVAAAPGNPGEFPGQIRATDDGFEYLHTDGRYRELTVPSTQVAELGQLLGLRDTAVALLSAEASSAEDTDEITTLRTRLNASYDAYVARNGAINRCSWHPTGKVDDAGEPVMSMRRPPVMRVFREDPHSPVVLALEDYDATTDSATKMAIMRQRVVAPRSPRLGAETPEDALAICMDTHGRVDLPAIAALLGISEDEALTQLRGLVYPDPAQNGRLVPAAEYLSGDVRTKLDQARQAARGTDPEQPAADPEQSTADAVQSADDLDIGDIDPEIYNDNVTALTAVIPPDLGPAEIDARLGAVWIDAPDVEAFLQEVLNDPSVTVEHTKAGEWKVSGGRRGILSTQEFGTSRVPAPKIAQALLRQTAIKVYDPNEDGEARIFNPTETEAANEKAEQLNERFSEWVWENPVRAQRLSDEYNRRFNNLVLRNYDAEGKLLSLPGLSQVYTPRPHQRAAVARMIAEPNVGLFHAVGAGKTLEMAMGVMELKRLGLVNKPAIMVPNHMLDQFAREFLQAYPQARVLAAGTEDLAGEKRRQFVARAATGDWDAIVMTRGSFQRLEVSRETSHWYFDREIEPRREYLKELAATGAKKSTVKRIEDNILRMEEKLKKKVGGHVDPGITFEQTGIDYIVVDELHEFKNLATDTAIESAAIAGSLRAQKLHMIVEHLRDKHNGRAITGATATPIANSITEAYVMQRYLRPDLLEKAGIRNFDEWAATFGKTKTELEMSVDGNSWAQKTRFSGFRNVKELQKMFAVPADVKLPEDLNLPVPKLARRPDGERAPEVVSVPATDTQLEFVRELGYRAEKVRIRAVSPKEDNMLKISSDGRAAALDLRLVKSLGFGFGFGPDEYEAEPTRRESPLLDERGGVAVATEIEWTHTVHPASVPDNPPVHRWTGTGQYADFVLQTSGADIDPQDPDKYFGVWYTRKDTGNTGTFDRHGSLAEVMDRVVKDHDRPNLPNTAAPDTANLVADEELIADDYPVTDDQFGLKLDAAADWLYEKWAANKDRVYLDHSGEPHPRRGGLVLAFCDLGTPGEGWNAYDELKSKLVERGAPPELVAYIHDAKNDKAKAALFRNARNGNIQVLFGSTSKMGVGTNVQDRLAAMLHIDCPWRPADIEQRDGRGVRQGNQNEEIAIGRMVTEGTFDARMWAAQARKASFINQFLKGQLDAREIDDIGDAALNANEALAIASGNPLVLEKAEVDQELTKLERLRRAHQRSQSMLQIRIRDANQAIPKLDTEIEAFTRAIEQRRPTRGDAFTATVSGFRYTSRGDAGDVLAARLLKLISDPRAVWKEFHDNSIGEIAGFTLNAHNVPTGRDALVSVVFPDIGDDYYVTLDKKTLEKGGTAVMIRIENAINGLDKRLEQATNRIQTEREELQRSEQRLGKPFEHADRLDTLRDRQREINRELLGANAEAQPQAENDQRATETDDRQFEQSAAMHDAIAMASMMGGVAIVNGIDGTSIIRGTGRGR